MSPDRGHHVRGFPNGRSRIIWIIFERIVVHQKLDVSALGSHFLQLAIREISRQNDAISPSDCVGAELELDRLDLRDHLILLHFNGRKSTTGSPGSRARLFERMSGGARRAA